MDKIITFAVLSLDAGYFVRRPRVAVALAEAQALA